MKKLLYLLPVIIVLFVSCGYDLKEPAKIANPGIDTVFYSTCEYEAPVIAPRFDCKGNKLSQPKVVGWETKKCVTVNHIRFNESLLNGRGYRYVGKTANIDSVNPPNHTPSKADDFGLSSFPWEWLFGLALAAFLIIMLIKLAKAPMTGTTKPTTTATSPTSPASPSPAPANQTASVNFSQRAEAIQKVLGGMKTNDMEGEFELGEGVKGKFTSKKGTKTEGPKGGDKKPAEGQDKKS